MSRNLLILALLVSGTGCSVTRPLLSTIVVTPPRLSFRQQPPEDSWNWAAVSVTYPSEILIPAPCSPSPVRSMELVTFFEDDECLAPFSLSGPVPAVTTFLPAPLVNVPVVAPPTIVPLENTNSPQSVHLPTTSVAAVSIGITPIAQTAVAVTDPSDSLNPAPRSPSRVPPVELVTFFEEEKCPAPPSPSGPVPAVTMVVPVRPVNVPAPAPPTIVRLECATSPQSADPSIPSVAPASRGGTPIVQTASTSTLPAPPVRGASPPPTESDWKPVTRNSLVPPVQTSTSFLRDHDETTLPEIRLVMPVEYLSPPVLVQFDVSDLFTEIRNQRQLIEALQRDLAHERSTDDADIDELEAAVEKLLDQTKTAQPEIPSTRRK